MSRHAIINGTVAAFAVIVSACVDAPFARTNPFDPNFTMSMEIVGGLDTVGTVGETMLFQLVTDPVIVAQLPTWESSVPTRVVALGFGRFTVLSLPPSEPQQVTIRARFGSNVVERVLVVMPPAS